MENKNVSCLSFCMFLKINQRKITIYCTLAGSSSTSKLSRKVLLDVKKYHYSIINIIFSFIDVFTTFKKIKVLRFVRVCTLLSIFYVKIIRTFFLFHKRPANNHRYVSIKIESNDNVIIWYMSFKNDDCKVK